ncbi:MAG: GGDEF domain-containing protein [Piscinibacter sp.]|uniref:GGDEF domain-containing protein n=1 Tax=Piscinibacter sp. TaxID=1903157 RepID=UPI00258DAB93|nr:GGDEF domain-containing protein [Piscinibacter sp.]MCW5663323.1 GGDEF domain-containing protein [Piscinibacter sp.]
MNGQTLRVLVVEQGVSAGLPARDALGPLELRRVAGLDAAVQGLDAGPVDALLLTLPCDALASLPAWPAFSRAVAEAAVLVACDGEPGLEAALHLVQLGVQDVLALDASALPRALRLAVERRRLQELSRKALGTDLLTGLPDQAQLAEQLTQLLAMRERQPAPMALLAVRLDGLAAAEARLGRESANALRRKIAVRLRVGLRAGDVVAALGADLLAVLLPQLQDVQDAARVADKLQEALRAPFAVAGEQVAIAAAIGAARYPQDGRDAATLLRLATGLAAAAPTQGRGGSAAPAAANDGA